MPEIPEVEVRSIQLPEVRTWLAEPPSVPSAPPVTLEIGTPIIDMPAFDPLDFEPEVQAPRVIPPKSKEPEPPAAPIIRLPKVEPSKPVEQEVEEPVNPIVQKVIEAVPTLPQAVNVSLSSAIAVSTALATPFLLKLIKPTIKKIATKIQKALGKAPKAKAPYQRRQEQRALRK